MPRKVLDVRKECVRLRKSVNGLKDSFNGKFPFTMVFVKTENDCGMVVKRFLDNQKGRSRKTPPETKRSEKDLEYIKGINLKICRQ